MKAQSIGRLESAAPTHACFNRYSSTKLAPVTTAPIKKATKAHQNASKAQQLLLIAHSYKKLRKPDAKQNDDATSSTISPKKTRAKQNKSPTSPPNNRPYRRLHRNNALCFVVAVIK
jgi:hypothetical protein